MLPLAKTGISTLFLKQKIIASKIKDVHLKAIAITNYCSK